MAVRVDSQKSNSNRHNILKVFVYDGLSEEASCMNQFVKKVIGTFFPVNLHKIKKF